MICEGHLYSVQQDQSGYEFIDASIALQESVFLFVMSAVACNASRYRDFAFVKRHVFAAVEDDDSPNFVLSFRLVVRFGVVRRLYSGVLLPLCSFSLWPAA